MSKKTNSLLLRYGLNVFWSSSISNPNLEFRMIVFLNLLTCFFKYFNFQILKIQNNLEHIFIYVYPYKERINFLVRYILYFEKSFLTKYILRAVYGLKIIKKTKMFLKLKKKDMVKKEKKIICFSYILFFLILKILILKWFICLKKLKFLSLKKIYLFPLFFNFSLLRIKKFFVKKKFLVLLNIYKLNLLNSFIKFKYIELYCSFLCFLYTKQKLTINVISIFEKPFIFYKVPFFFKYLKKSFLKQKLYVINLSFLFLKGRILLHYIHIIVKKTKNKKHIKNLLTFFRELKIIFTMQYLPLCGFKFRIAGRLGGKLRKGTFFFKLGHLKLLTFTTFLDYSFYIVHSVYGVFSLKLWLSCSVENNQLVIN